MSNSHAVPDSLYELQSVCGDLLPGVIRSHSGLSVPASSMTLAAVAVTGYVMGATELVYVAQPAVSITLAGGNGTYWLCLHRDLSTAVAGWTRRAGSHYLWQLAGSQPAAPVGGLVFASVTVAAGVISAVTVLPTPTSQPLSKQLANAVAITGGTISGVTYLATTGNVGINTTPTGQALQVNGAMTASGNCNLGGNVVVGGNLGLANVGPGFERILMPYGGGGVTGMTAQAQLTGTNYAHVFTNSASTVVGSISATDTATSFNTSSDARLKTGITPLTGALDVLRAFDACSWRWKADGSPGVGFVAAEVQPHVPLAVTGEPDAVNEDGSIRPQGMDVSKLVPWLWASCQTLLAQVEALTARLEALEG